MTSKKPSSQRKTRNKKPPQSHFVQYTIVFSIAFLVVVALGAFYVDDVRDGLGVILQSIAEKYFADLL